MLFKKDSAKRLRTVMAAQDVNTSELAYKTGLSMATISNLRTGRVKKPQADTALAIARALNVNVSYLWDNV